MFPPLNNSNEFYTQQGFCRMKACVEKEIGVRFQLRAGRRAFGQRLLDSGNRIEDVSVAIPRRRPPRDTTPGTARTR